MYGLSQVSDLDIAHWMHKITNKNSPKISLFSISLFFVAKKEGKQWRLAESDGKGTRPDSSRIYSYAHTDTAHMRAVIGRTGPPHHIPVL